MALEIEIYPEVDDVIQFGKLDFLYLRWGDPRYRDGQYWCQL